MNYDLIPMDKIDPEARKLSVLWMECDDKHWIGQKHKLASDIMNYHANKNKELLSDKKLLEMFNKITCFESREMTFERFNQAIEELLIT